MPNDPGGGRFLHEASQTRWFTFGAPSAVTVTGDGTHVVFLRAPGPDSSADALWVFDVATGTERLLAEPADLGDAAAAPGPVEEAMRERQRLFTGGIGAYATDDRTVTFVGAGGIGTVPLAGGPVGWLPGWPGAVDPRPGPDGIAFVCDGTLRLIRPDGVDVLVAGAEPGITWGLPDFIAAEEFGRHRGFWWAPDGGRILVARVDDRRVRRVHLADPGLPERSPATVAYPFAGGTNTETTLHLCDLRGGTTEVRWDRESHPYVVEVGWFPDGLLVTVLRRDQRHGYVLQVDPDTGRSRVHASLSDPCWVDVVPGTPCRLPDGRIVVGGVLPHGGRGLAVDDVTLTRPDVYVRRLAGLLPRPDGRVDLIVEASGTNPAEQHVLRIATDGSASAPRPLTEGVGWHVVAVGRSTWAIGRRSLDRAGERWSVWRDGTYAGTLRSNAAAPPPVAAPLFHRVTERRLPVSVLYPRGHLRGRRLPVLVSGYGGPGRQEIVARADAWMERQWFANSGFAVVTVDNRGTPGVSPSYERAAHRRWADVILADLLDALDALTDRHPDLDRRRIAIRGGSFGGWVAGLAVLSRPDVFRCGTAVGPVTDWRWYNTAYTERYLGMPADDSDLFDRHDLVGLAATPRASPLLLVHGLADDNVLAVHTLRLSAALLAAGHPHSVVPIGNVAHMYPARVAGAVLTAERDFIHRHL